MGEEEGIKEEERKGRIALRGRGVRNAIGRKERMDAPNLERRKDLKRKKGKDGWPKAGEEE